MYWAFRLVSKIRVITMYVSGSCKPSCVSTKYRNKYNNNNNSIIDQNIPVGGCNRQFMNIYDGNSCVRFRFYVCVIIKLVESDEYTGANEIYIFRSVNLTYKLPSTCNRIQHKQGDYTQNSFHWRIRSDV